MILRHGRANNVSGEAVKLIHIPHLIVVDGFSGVKGLFVENLW